MSDSYIFDHENSKSREQKLQQLIQEAQKQVIEQKSELLLGLIQEIVKIILASRPICRKYNGQPLSGIYLEIYNQVQTKLLESITQRIEQSSSVPSNSTWLYLIQDRAFKTILDDANLKKMALAAQKIPPNSSLRSYSLNELVKAIQLSQRLIRMRKYSVSPEFDRLIYEEAVMETLAYVCTKIELYDPNRGNKKFMNWVNFRLEKNLIKCSQQFRDPNIIKISSITDLENIGYKKNKNKISELLWEYIQQDAENRFESVFINNHPEANFKQIALARLSGQTWKEISQRFGISISTLSSFFQRNCEKFHDLFNKEFKN